MAKDKRTSVYFDREQLKFVGLENAHIQQLKDTYKNIDVDSELKKMCIWLQSSKGKKVIGQIGFIINWLNRITPTIARSEIDQLPLFEEDTPLRPLIQEYLRELWKGKEHILEFNKIKRKI